jgi:hypothetical protein
MRSADTAGMRVKRTPNVPPVAPVETISPEAVTTSLHPGSWNCKPTKRVAEPAPLMGWIRIPVRLMSDALQR